MMIKNAKEQMLSVIGRVNDEIFIPKGIYLKYKQKWLYVSIIEIRTVSKAIKKDHENRL